MSDMNDDLVRVKGDVGKVMRLPLVMPFEGLTKPLNGRPVRRTYDCYWVRDRWGQPRRGEFFVSGAPPTAYRAPNDLSKEYLIVRPTYFAKRVTRYIRGDEVRT